MIARVSILGLGWLGEPLALELANEGYDIKGSTTSLNRLCQLSKHPFYVGRLKINHDELLGDWEAFCSDADVLIINFPPKRVDNIEQIYPAQMQQIIQRCSPSTKVIFVSSTSVYGNTNAVVTEDCITSTEKTSGKAVLAAERVLKAHFGKNLTVLRLSGLIGPQRHPGRFLSAKRMLKNAASPVNLIHQADCIGLIKSIFTKNCFGETINGCADEHPIRESFYTKAAKELNLSPPTFDNSTKSAYKIVANTKSKTLLNYSYNYSNPEQIFDRKNMAKVSIVGAGPGHQKLLTLEALEYIEQAEIILHDNLVTQTILDLNKKAERIYVGRKYGDQSDQQQRQDRINQLLECHFLQGKKVVRLKSGDPYVYGRAAEEARYLQERKIPFNVVPGISAALAAANSCNIPITERRKSNAVLICTAHTADYSFEQLKGIAALLKAGNSLALYMGLKSIDKLIPKLLEVCGDGTIPINAVSNVSRDNQILLTSTLENIEQDLITHPLEMPVVFLIGVNPIAQ